MSHDNASLIGTTLGDKYRLDALLGAGGFGAVYRGWHLLLDEPVAVKVAFRVDGSLGRRFRREARTLMRLRHPRIVRMYDYGRDPRGHVYMVQEFVTGRPLDELLQSQGRLPPLAVAEIGRQVLEALAAAHAQDIVHRDIKPANIMLQGGLDAPAVQLLDFGIAKMYGAGDDSELTRPGGSPGTPAYMAPEQIHGHAEPASDLYALGATLFRLLTGSKPFPYPVPRVYLAHIKDPVPPLGDHVPAPLAAIVTRSLAKEPGDRHADAAAMAAALQAFLASQRASGAPSPPVRGAGGIGFDDTVPSTAPTVRPPPGLADVDGESTSAEGKGAIASLAPSTPTRTGRPGWLPSLLLACAVGLVAGGVHLWRTADAPPPDAPDRIVATGAIAPAPAVEPAAADALVFTRADAAPEAVRPADAAPAPDATPPAPDARPSPPRPAPPRRTRRPPARTESRKALASRLEEQIEAALADCRCDDVRPELAKLQALDRASGRQMRQRFTTRCVVVGLPGGCR